MIRLAFNSGEVDEEVSLRMDVDAMSRACLRLENWEVSDMGGIRRRHGFRKFADGVQESALVPFVYTYAAQPGQRFLIEVRKKEVNVWGLDGERVAHFESGNQYALQFEFTPKGIRHKQINKLLILTSLDQKPWVIKRNDDGTWEMEPYEFKIPPWRRTGTQAESVKLYKEGDEYRVEFGENVSESERDPNSYDKIRLSYWTEQSETRAGAGSLCADVSTVETAPATAKKGDKFAVRSDDIITYWVCIKDFVKADTYCAGLDDPGSYPDNFLKAENTAGFESVSPVLSVNGLAATTKKGSKIAIKAGYWEYYTCIRDFTRPAKGGNLDEYPSFFIRGLAVGKALPSKGAWSFFCSGLWYGSYEVRRNYETDELDTEWEARGISFSQCASPSNVQLTGEEQEECYLRLFITRSRYMGDSVKSGFPPDGCDNKLIVEGYKHDEILECHTIDGVTTWENVTPIPQASALEREITDWSWTSFSPRYGFPLLCEVYSQRLIFASTPAQPQTMWCSAVDDLTNFELGSTANAAMELTINDTSQNPMCWVQSKNNNLLIGTSEAEWVVMEGSAGFTAGSLKINDHGHIGSDGIASLATSDKVLYVERGGGRVYEYGYSYETDGYQSIDLTQLAPHIARDHGGVVSCAFIRKPRAVAVFVLGDGQLGMCTYNRNQQVNAWGRWKTEGRILNACVVPNGNENDLLFMVVERENGVSIEVYDTENDYTDNGNDYESVLLTNALFNPMERHVQKTPQMEIQAKLGEDVSLLGEDGESEPGAVQLSGDGEFWLDVDRSGAKLKKGWDTFVPPAGIKWEPRLGLKVKGRRGFSLYCLQA